MINLIFRVNGKETSRLNLSETEAHRTAEIIFAHSREWASPDDLKASMVASELDRCVQVERGKGHETCTNHQV